MHSIPDYPMCVYCQVVVESGEGHEIFLPTGSATGRDGSVIARCCTYCKIKYHTRKPYLSRCGQVIMPNDKDPYVPPPVPSRSKGQ